MRGMPAGTSRSSNWFVKQFTALALDRREAVSAYVKGLPPRRNARLVAQATTGVLACAALLVSDTAASAQGVEQFYRGKTINFVIGNAAAGAPDAYARLVARHIGNYIPGNPKVIARNMPGA